MKPLRSKLLTVGLAMVFAGGTALTLAGCEDPADDLEPPAQEPMAPPAPAEEYEEPAPVVPEPEAEPEEEEFLDDEFEEDLDEDAIEEEEADEPATY